ncbi:hypothetical protein CLV47_103260 [Antricoccus suffuscus]|uniref:Uncharacterized protein n=1 Tax=Antricoccus suffuscus TaxID=1629062 RepID=A0A2T1A3M4_9ACTN|nr:hypothetical protein CLV47_103260 [Antricoccus suffuscus]
MACRRTVIVPNGVRGRFAYTIAAFVLSFKEFTCCAHFSHP